MRSLEWHFWDHHSDAYRSNCIVSFTSYYVSATTACYVSLSCLTSALSMYYATIGHYAPLWYTLQHAIIAMVFGAAIVLVQQ